jgi:MFS family permease
MGQTFFTVFALKQLGAGDGHVGTFTLVLMGAQAACTMIFGWIADRYGHRLVLMLGTICIVLASLLALRAQSPEDMYLAFAATGASLGATFVSHFAILLAFGDTKDRPTYVALGNTLLSPLSFAAQITGGLLADNVGYGAVFGTAAALAVLSVVVLGAFVREPRPGQEVVLVEETPAIPSP